MASPQKENGYVAIANEIVEHLAQINLSPYEMRLLWAVLRKTYGWSKKKDVISVSQFEGITGLDRRNASRAKKSLQMKGLICIEGDFIKFNKDYDQWGKKEKEQGTIVYRDTRPRYFPPLGFPYKDGGDTHCGYCFKIVSYKNGEVHSHHIVPRAQGGKDAHVNTISVCVPCHKKIHSEMDEWLSVNSDDIGGWYRHFMSLVSSKQTQYLSSVETVQKQSKTTIQKKDPKFPFGEFKNVLLTVSEKEKLKELYGVSTAKKLVQDLSIGIESKGYKYKSHYATLRGWARRDKVPELEKPKPKKVEKEVELTEEEKARNAEMRRKISESIKNKFKKP